MMTESTPFCDKFIGLYSSTEKDFRIDANKVRAFMWYLLSGVETIIRFVNICLHCNVGNLKKISKMLTFKSHGKISADTHDYFHPFKSLDVWEIRLS